MTNAQLRRPSAFWLAVTTLFGLAGTFVGLLPVIVTWMNVRAGTVSLASAMGTMVLYASLMFCPLLAWWLLLRRQYGLAIIIASPPILLWVISLVVGAIG